MQKNPKYVNLYKRGEKTDMKQLSMEELIQLKYYIENENKNYRVLKFENGEIINDDMTYTELEISDILNTGASIARVPENFNQLIRFFSGEEPNHESIKISKTAPRYEYDELIIKPSFGLLISEEYYDYENGKILDESKIINDIVYVDFYNYILKNNGIEVTLNSKRIPLYDSGGIFIVSFNDFLIGLNELGFELQGISSFNKLKKDTTTGEIGIKFIKSKKLIKK